MSRVLPADSVSTGGATTGAPRVDLSGANFKGARLTGACRVGAGASGWFPAVTIFQSEAVAHRF